MRKERIKHFTLEEWADFLREVTSREQRAAMRRHLDQGCRKCLKVVGLWRNVADFARNEQAFLPPDTAVRAAKASYAIHGPQAQVSGVAKVAQLIFDSFRQPIPAGVRSAGVSFRQLLYKVGDIQVDLRLESEAQRNRISMLGQILDSSKFDPGVKGAVVVLFREEQPTARTVTNEFGEFQLELDSEEAHQLSIEIGRQQTVFIHLRGVEPRPDDIKS